MAPHLTLVEQSRALQASAKGETPMAVFDMLESKVQVLYQYSGIAAATLLPLGIIFESASLQNSAYWPHSENPYEQAHGGGFGRFMQLLCVWECGVR